MEKVETILKGKDLTYGLNLYTMASLMAMQFPEDQWVIEALVPEGITVVSAPAASFKTWLLLAMISSVAAGTEFLGNFAVTQTGVLVIDEENPLKQLQKRLRMLGVKEDLPIHFMVEDGFKLEPAKVKRVIRFCQEKDIKLVTIDSLVRVHSAKENEAKDMAAVFGNLRLFTKAGISVLVTHHNRKGGKTENASEDMRGSSDIRAAVDCHIALKRDESNLLALNQTKLRIAEEIGLVEVQAKAEDGKMRLEYIGTLGRNASKRTRTEDALVEILRERGKANQKELYELLHERGAGINEKTLRKILIAMTTRKAVTATRGKGSELVYALKEVA